MRKHLLVVLFCFLAGSLLAEPIRHPVTGEQGFFISIVEMKQTVVIMKERDLYKELYTNERLRYQQDQACFKTTKVVAYGEAGVIILETLLLWVLR